MSDTATPSPDPLSQTEFLQIRNRLLDLAAALDRAQRAGWNRDRDARGQKIAEAFEILSDDGPDRAARIQQLFSLAHDPNWRESFQLTLRTTLGT